MHKIRKAKPTFLMTVSPKAARILPRFRKKPYKTNKLHLPLQAEKRTTQKLSPRSFEKPLPLAENSHVGTHGLHELQIGRLESRLPGPRKAHCPAPGAAPRAQDAPRDGAPLLRARARPRQRRRAFPACRRSLPIRLAAQHFRVRRPH